VKALAFNKHYDEAQTFLAQRLQAVSTTPKTVQRQRDMAAIYTTAADIEETRKQWVRGAEYRAHAVEALATLKPSDYDDQRSDLLFAYSFLSWDEIFSGQTAAGIADTQNAISLSMKSEPHTGLYAVYENGVNALMQNSKYEQAGTLLDSFNRALSASPAGTLREREFATVFDVDMARLAEVRKQWSQAVTYRSDEVKRLLGLDPKAYDTLKADLVSAYGGLSFEEEEAGNFAQGVEAAKAGLKLDPSQSWIEENEANGLLLSGHPDDAKALYMKVKDVQWQGAAMSAAISDDLHTFCTLGYTRPEMTGIAHELGIKNDELYACLAASTQHPSSH
jgi:tetratricopeptide (TPR) repeat protein